MKGHDSGFEHSTLVTIRGPPTKGGKEPNSSDDVGNSGILIDYKNGFVLTHASILFSFFDEMKDIYQLFHTKTVINKHEAKCFFDLKINVLLQRKEPPVKVDRGASLSKYHTALINCNVNQSIQDNVTKSASLETIFLCRNFSNALKKLMPKEDGWKFIDDGCRDNESPQMSKSKPKEKDEISVDMIYSCLPWFVLLRLDNWTPIPSIFHVYPAENCSVGDVVEICATPFGNLSPEIFLNSWSRGILSNMSGPGKVLMLTDSRCIPGSEGGPLYTRQRGRRFISGIIVASLCWKNSEWIGLAVACSISEVVSSLQSLINMNIPDLKGLHCPSDKSSLSSCDPVVMIRVGNSWGSGVIIEGGDNNGLLLTCSHVIKGHQQHPVQVRRVPTGDFVRADVVYQTPEGEPFDLAVLRVNGPQQWPSYRIGSAVTGDHVRVIGHALFGEEKQLYPTITSGVISSILSFSKTPVLIQTTCAVHSGASGGAVVNQFGQLVGLVVCNAKDLSSGACFPHINMCVPMVTIWPVFKKYLQSNDPSILSLLHIKNKKIQQLWKLDLSPTEEYKEFVSSKL